MIEAAVEVSSEALDHDEFVLIHRHGWRRFRDAVAAMQESG